MNLQHVIHNRFQLAFGKLFDRVDNLFEVGLVVDDNTDVADGINLTDGNRGNITQIGPQRTHL